MTAPLRIVHLGEAGHVLFEGAARIAGYGDPAMAQARLDRLTRQRQQITRPCLCCNAPFASANIGNRLCRVCIETIT
jgi:hypothetical protein